MLGRIGEIIAGKYANYKVLDIGDKLKIKSQDTNSPDSSLLKKSDIAWSIFQEDDTTSTAYSFWKGVGGAILFGPLGLIAGAGGKKTGEKTYLIEIVWNDTQEKSLLKLDEKGYQTFLRYMY